MSSEIDQSSRMVSNSAEPPAPPAAPSPVSSSSGSTEVEKSSPIPAGIEAASDDDLGRALIRSEPDPFLEGMDPSRTRPTPPPEESSTVAHAPDALDLGVTPGAEAPAPSGSSSGLSAVFSALNLDPATTNPPAPAPGESTSGPGSTPEDFAGLDLDAPSRSKASASPLKGKDGAVEDEDEDHPPRGSNWPLALLASYASAVTIGLIWVLYGHRAPREVVEVDPFPPADNAGDPGRRADQSRKVTPPPLPPDRIATMGQTVRLGSIEVTPLKVTNGPVTLRRDVGKPEAKPGGIGTLSLMLRLKNVATDTILFPLDEAFLRERGRGIRDSFIETGPSRRIEMFPLAVESEWSIVGQEFRKLEPGESYETRVVSAPDALDQLATEMTWRIRLRTEVNQSETLGVRFREDEIRGRSGGTTSPRK